MALGTHNNTPVVWTQVNAVGSGGTSVVGGPVIAAGELYHVKAKVFGVNGTDGFFCETECTVTRNGGSASFVAFAGAGANPATLLTYASDFAYNGVGPSTAVWSISGTQAILTITNKGGGANDFLVLMITYKAAP